MAFDNVNGPSVAADGCPRAARWSHLGPSPLRPFPLTALPCCQYLRYPVGRSGFEQVELFGFGETEEMKQCRAAQNKLEPLLRIYFDSSWRKIDNEASATLRAPLATV